MSLSIINPTSTAALQAIEPPQDAPETGPTDCYRVLLFNGAGTAVLLFQNDSGAFLPEIRIPRFTRIAEQVTSLLRNTWGVRTVLLFSGSIEGASPEINYAALEDCTGSWPVPPGTDWYPFTWAASRLVSQNEGDVLRSSQARAIRRSVINDSEPFSRLGWMGRLQEWVQSVLNPRGIQLRDFAHLNGTEAFSLIRFDTTKTPVWFKAVGKPNLHEFPVTSVLARLFPDYLPPILASDSLLNGWLMESAGNSTLENMKDPSIWRTVVHRIASLQIESIGQSVELLDAGCRDLRIGTLATLVDSFFDLMTGLMQQQTKLVPAPLSRPELLDLASIVKYTLRSLGDIGIPDTLGHCDVNPENILVQGDHIVFTDWAEAHVGHPLLTFEYLCRAFCRSNPNNSSEKATLASTYVACWGSLISEQDIRFVLLRAPLIAAFAYAIGTIRWTDPEETQQPRIAAWLRSLTRQMHHQANLLRERVAQ